MFSRKGVNSFRELSKEGQVSGGKLGSEALQIAVVMDASDV